MRDQFDEEVFAIVTEIGDLVTSNRDAEDVRKANAEVWFQRAADDTARVFERAATASRGTLTYRGDQETDKWKRRVLFPVDSKSFAPFTAEIRKDRPGVIEFFTGNEGNQETFSVEDDSASVQGRVEAAIIAYLEGVRKQFQMRKGQNA
jgi:hypothetical protein